MSTKTETLRNKLLKKFHSLLRSNGINDDQKDAILTSFSVESAADLNETQLIAICNRLEVLSNDQADLWRKRVMAAIGAWLRKVGRTESSDYIKSMACRASKKDNFNKLTIPELRSVYFEFVRKAKTNERVAKLTAKEVRFTAMLN